MNLLSHPSEAPGTPLIEAIATALEGLQYGSIEIVVHDGRVVQFERRERIRFAQPLETRRRN